MESCELKKSIYLWDDETTDEIASVALSPIEELTHSQRNNVYSYPPGGVFAASTVSFFVDSDAEEDRLSSLVDSVYEEVLGSSELGSSPSRFASAVSSVSLADELFFDVVDFSEKDREVIAYKVISEGVIQLTDRRFPPFEIQGEESFVKGILGNLSELLKEPLSKSFLATLRDLAIERGAKIEIVKAEYSSALQGSKFESENLLVVEISESSEFGVCKTDSGLYELELVSSEIVLLHELTHAYHFILGEDHVLEPNDSGFDSHEELVTIGRIEGVEDQVFTENAYRRAFGMQLRVGHFGCSEALLSEFEEEMALRNSIQVGCYFTFLAYAKAQFRKVYSSVGLTSDTALSVRKNRNSDIKKLFEHAQSQDYLKVLFAIMMLENMKPFITAAKDQRELDMRLSAAREHLEDLFMGALPTS